MARPIRIMHIVDNFGGGGLERGVVKLVEGLDPCRFEHLVYALRYVGASAERLANGPVRVICAGNAAGGSRFQMPALVHAIRDAKPDIVHARNWGGVEAVLAGRWVRSCAVVYSEHGLESNVTAREPWRRIGLRRLAFELANRVVCVSRQLRDLHARRTGFMARRITVIHNGVDSARFFPDAGSRARVRAELGIAEGELCIGCVANLSTVKDHMTLLKAVAGIAEARADWRLLIVGQGQELSKLTAFAASQPRLQDRVCFLGASQRVPELLRAMDIHVLPSLTEGISNSLLEAMASGVPVIATETGGNPEVVVDGKSGMLFPVGDSGRLTELLLQVRERKDLRERLGQQALHRARSEFSIESMIQSYDRLYQSVSAAAATTLQALAGA